MALSDAQLRKIRPSGSRFELTDGKGLTLLVLPSGTRSWLLRYQYEGKPRRISLGEYPNVGLAEARTKAETVRADIKNGIDPAQKRAAEKTKRRTAPTFKNLLDEFWEMELTGKPTGEERWRLVEKDAIPEWGRRKVADITRRDAVLLLDKVRKRAPITANRLQGVLVRMFNFASERGIIEHSPLTGLRRPREQARSRVLTNYEIKMLWAAVDIENTKVDIYRATKLALKMILLTGQRPGEVCGMTWAEIDEESAFWNIPAERMKNGENNRVPLCNMALNVIEQAKAYSADSPFVFRSPFDKDRSVTRPALTKAIARHWSEMGFQKSSPPRSTPHHTDPAG
jgi:integrase